MTGSVTSPTTSHRPPSIAAYWVAKLVRRSIAGFWLKKLWGRSLKLCQIIGITGMSSARGSWCMPMLAHTTMSWFWIGRFCSVQTGRPPGTLLAKM